MRQSSFWQRLTAATATLAAVAVIAMPVGQASAAGDEEAPFDDATRVADASLDTMRGGFEPPGANFVVAVPPSLPAFAMNGDTKVNNQPVSSWSLDSHNGQLTYTSANIGNVASIMTTAGQIPAVTLLTDRGFATFVQNVNSKVALNIQQQLNLVLSSALVRNNLGGSALANSIRASARR